MLKYHQIEVRYSIVASAPTVQPVAEAKGDIAEDYVSCNA